MKLQNILNLIKNNFYFYIPYFFIFIVTGLSLIFIEKGDFLIFINQYHNSFFDIFFKYATYLGEGYYFLVILIILALYRIKYLVQGVVLFISSGAITQILKNIFNYPRPIQYFQNTINLNFVDGVDVYSWGSFPSGHTTSAFTIFLFFAIHLKRREFKLLFLALAILVAISRVYLVQHFLIDVWLGSFVGVVSTTIIYIIIDNSTRLNNSKWYNYSILRKDL